MEKKSSFSLSLKSSLPAVVLALIVFSLMVITKHHYSRLTADSMLYFSLAEKYISGDFSNAINGYWGPLLAWLLVPFLYAGASHLFTINALNLVIGICTILGVWKLSYTFDISETVRSIVVFSFIPIVLKFSVVQPMDFLLVCFLIYYLVVIFKGSYPERVTNGLLCGLLGALAYFSKSYAFPFFVVHFIVMNVLHYLRNSEQPLRKNIVINAVAGLMLFSLISGAWVMAIGDKYGYYTISTMRKTNFNAPGPDAMGGGLEFGVPVFTQGLFEPPNETAFVVWEDPSYLRGQPWSPFQSKRHFIHFIKLTLKNLSDGLKIFETFSTLSIAILLAYILLMCKQSMKTLFSRRELYPIFTLVLFTGGYALFHYEERYLWLSYVLLLLMGGHVLQVLLQKEFFGQPLRRNLLILCFVFSFIFTPAKYVKQVMGGGMDGEMYLTSTDLIKHDIKGNIASNREHVPVHDSWHKTFRLAYWLKGSRYYGQTKEKINDKELEQELQENNISYYFFWGHSGNTPQFLTQCREVTGGEIPGLKIYSLNEKKDSSEQ